MGTGTLPGMESDEELARRVWVETIEPGLVEDGMPEDGLEHLRERYVENVLGRPHVLRQLREGFDLGETTGEVWARADREWEALPQSAKAGLRQEDWRQGFIHGYVGRARVSVQ